MSVTFDLVELLLLLEYNTTELLSQQIFNGHLMFVAIGKLMTKFSSHIIWFDASKQDINSTIMVKTVS